MPNTSTIRKNIKINNYKFVLEIYPARNGCNGKEGPYWEIFPHDRKASLYAFSNKDKLNKKIEAEYL